SRWCGSTAKSVMGPVCERMTVWSRAGERPCAKEESEGYKHRQEDNRIGWETLYFWVETSRTPRLPLDVPTAMSSPSGDEQTDVTSPVLSNQAPPLHTNNLRGSCTKKGESPSPSCSASTKKSSNVSGQTRKK